MKVNVGTGGLGNLEEHKLSKNHRDRLIVNKTPSIAIFFSPRVPEPGSSAPKPPLLQNRTRIHGCAALPSSSSAPAPAANKATEAVSSTPHLIKELRSLAALLPESVPVGTIKERLAGFSTIPVFGPPSSDFWEDCGDSLTNQFFGIDVPGEDIKNMMRRSKYGIDGICNWFEIIVVEGGVNPAVLEGKVGRITQALREL